MKNSMDYIYSADEEKIVIEVEQRSTRRTVIEQYVRCRKMQGMTQEQLADRLGITDRHIRGIERGDFFPSIDLYVLIAESFEISLDMLILGAQPSAKEMQMQKRLQEQERIVQQQRESIEQAIYILCMIKNK